MKQLHLTPLGTNMSELRIGDVYVLFSYQEAVAYRTAEGRLYATAKKWSATTSRHIKQWCAGERPVLVPQHHIDKLLAGQGESDEGADVQEQAKEVSDGETS